MPILSMSWTASRRNENTSLMLDVCKTTVKKKQVFSIIPLLMYPQCNHFPRPPNLQQAYLKHIPDLNVMNTLFKF